MQIVSRPTDSIARLLARNLDSLEVFATAFHNRITRCSRSTPRISRF